jgi:hypothetical protein
VDVSGPAQFIAVAQAEIAKVPDVRTERVEALRAAIDSEAYHPDGEAVADGLVREHSPMPPGPWRRDLITPILQRQMLQTAALEAVRAAHEGNEEVQREVARRQFLDSRLAEDKASVHQVSTSDGIRLEKNPQERKRGGGSKDSPTSGGGGRGETPEEGAGSAESHLNFLAWGLRGSSLGGARMLHSVPALVDELEARLVSGGDPLALINSIQWGNLVGWPTNLEEARKLKGRVEAVTTLLQGLQAPIRATVMALNPEVTYGPGRGRAADLLPPRVHHRI